MRVSLLLAMLLLSMPGLAEQEQLPEDGLLEFLAEMEAATGDRFSEWLQEAQPDFDERGDDDDE